MGMKYRKNLGRPGVIVANMSYKGGTGKTSNIFTMLCLLAQQAVHILAVDMDPQANLTRRFGVSPDDFEGNITAALHGITLNPTSWGPLQMRENVFDVKMPGINQHVDLLPGSETFENATTLLERRRDPNVHTRLRLGLETLRDYYDFIFIDTPPGADNLRSALVLNSVDVLLLPVDGFDALLGATTLLEAAQKEAEERKRDGRAPLRAFLYVPHLINSTHSDPETTPWYRSASREFPSHFIPQVVRHSSTHQKSHLSGRGWTGLSWKTQQQYSQMFQHLMGLMQNSAYMPLLDWLEAQKMSLPEIRQRIEQDRLRDSKTETVISRIKYR